MTELEVLDGNIIGLKKLLKVAWQDLANPSLPDFEHREARNQIKKYSAELRRYLQLKKAERGRPRNQFLISHDFRNSSAPNVCMFRGPSERPRLKMNDMLSAMQ